MGQRIILVEDDPDLALSLRMALERDGFDIETFARGHDGLVGILDRPPDLVLLDLNLPDLDGIGVCQEVRQTPAVHDLPIIMITARISEADRVRGLDQGADDYITKPFSLRELKSRINALLRRRSLDQGVPENEYTDRRLVVRHGSRTITLDGTEVHLTRRELELLWHLIANRPRVVSREQILERVWGLAADVETRTVDVHVRALRAKLTAGSIETVIGTGYRFRGFQ